MKFGMLSMIIALGPCIAHAEQYGGAVGSNVNGQILRITGETYEDATVYLHKQSGELIESYVMQQECPSFLAIDTKKQFSCKHDGKSPLAGTTYKVTTSKQYRVCNDPNEGPAEIYECIVGCNPRAPKIFRVLAYECDPQ